MKALTRTESRDVDRWAIEELGLPGIVLMENAGRGIADVLMTREPSPKSVLILCGKGNNGGDGFVVARHLDLRGLQACVALLASPDELRGDALINYKIIERLELSIVDLSQVENRLRSLDAIPNADWIVDAMLGTGATGDPREPYRSAIEWLNRQDAQKLAVDVPSGLDCDTGEPSFPTVEANLTCTMHAPKVGFAAEKAQHYLGQLQVVSIGIPVREKKSKS